MKYKNTNKKFQIIQEFEKINKIKKAIHKTNCYTS